VVKLGSASRSCRIVISAQEARVRITPRQRSDGRLGMVRSAMFDRRRRCWSRERWPSDSCAVVVDEASRSAMEVTPVQGR
jgi:hypothetical protein